MDAAFGFQDSGLEKDKKTYNPKSEKSRTHTQVTHFPTGHIQLHRFFKSLKRNSEVNAELSSQSY